MSELYVLQKMWPFTTHRPKKDVDLNKILELTKTLVIRSDESFYSGFTPDEIAADLSAALQALDDGGTLDKDNLRMHFAPTGPIQETAMESGWADEYLKLAELFDDAIKRIR